MIFTIYIWYLSPIDSNTSFPIFQSFDTLLLLRQFLPQQFSLMKAECSCGQRKTRGGWKSNGVVISCLIWLTLIIGWSIHDKVYSPIVRFQSDPEVFDVYWIIFASLYWTFIIFLKSRVKGLCSLSKISQLNYGWAFQTGGIVLSWQIWHRCTWALYNHIDVTSIRSCQTFYDLFHTTRRAVWWDNLVIP